MSSRLLSSISLRSSLTRCCRPSFSTYATNLDPSLVTWELDESTKIGTITLNNPKAFNALTIEAGLVFSDRIREINTQLTVDGAECHAIVLTGAGDQAFSAGGNLEWLRSLKDNSVQDNADAMVRFYSSFLIVRTLPVPVIAAMQGPGVGAGAGLALACDLRTVANKPRILGLNFTKLGIHVGMGASQFFPLAMGPGNAILNEALLLGKMLSGQECFDYSIANRLSDDPKGDAYEMASEIAKQNPVAVRSIVQTMRVRQNDGLEAALQREALSQALCYNQSDWGEGVNAAAEKREPVFKPYHTK